jgi:hypothetical protein
LTIFRGGQPPPEKVKAKAKNFLLDTGGILCYTVSMMIKEDSLFKVTIGLWRTCKGPREIYIRAQDFAHAKRISNERFGTLGITVHPKPRKVSRW